MDFYYAVFEQTAEAVEVYFPDIPNAVTFADTLDDAFTMATDVLAAVLVDYDKRPKKTPFADLKDKHDGILMAIPVDEKIMQSYEQTKRVNVCFPTSVLTKIDEFRGKHALGRSEFLAKASAEYIATHQQ
ncbi:MAG: type II toxin-antitoxin system HicB family antitoxin [Proteobacteria bacterium]|nr:type II toxin-antitoxin system HicB family antitoxin [Pseudomonadota bacterium]